jgi:hypothetical protein
MGDAGHAEASPSTGDRHLSIVGSGKKCVHLRTHISRIWVAFSKKKQSGLAQVQLNNEVTLLILETRFA